jgi:hypothetical protein
VQFGTSSSFGVSTERLPDRKCTTPRPGAKRCPIAKTSIFSAAFPAANNKCDAWHSCCIIAAVDLLLLLYANSNEARTITDF